MHLRRKKNKILQGLGLVQAPRPNVKSKKNGRKSAIFVQKYRFLKMIFIFLLVPKYEGKQNVSIDIVREKERRRNTPGTRVGPGFRDRTLAAKSRKKLSKQKWAKRNRRREEERSQ